MGLLFFLLYWCIFLLLLVFGVSPGIAAIISAVTELAGVLVYYLVAKTLERIQENREEQERARRRQAQEEEDRGRWDPRQREESFEELRRRMLAEQRRRANEEQNLEEQRRRATQSEPQPNQNRDHQFPVELTQIQVVIQDNNRKLRLGRLVNPTNDSLIRLALMIQVHEPGYTGKAWPAGRPIKACIYSPRGGLKATFTYSPTLVMGENRLLDRGQTFQITPRTTRGTWTIKTFIGDREWGNPVEFVVSNANADALQQEIGGDMELTPEAQRLADEIAGTTDISDIL